LDWGDRVLALDDREPVAFNGLVIAACAGTNFFGVPGGALPGVAQPSIQSGQHTARQLTRTFGRTGRPTPFRYKDKGIMATIGRRAAARFPDGFTPKGTLGWWSLLLLRLVYLIGFRIRISVMVNRTWNYFTWDCGPRLVLWTDRPRRRQ
jgi:NADH dehydrogenase